MTESEIRPDAAPVAGHQPETETPSAPQAAPVAGGATTGDPRVDAALDRLHELDALPAAEQIPVLEDIHRRLQDALADLDGD